MPNKLHRLTSQPAIEQRTMTLGGTPVTFTLKRTPRRRSIGLRIDHHGLTVNMPLDTPEQWLHSVLQDKAHWVVNKLEGWQARKPVPALWQDGQSISFLGKPVFLRIVISLFATPPLFRDGQLLVHVTDTTSEALTGQIVMQWYQGEARNLFRKRIAHYAPLLGVTPHMVKLSSARTQWGSCTAKGVVRLHWQLIKMPQHLIDYVIVHELAHLIEMNHSAAFWQVVETACPDYARQRSELRQWQIAPS